MLIKYIFIIRWRNKYRACLIHYALFCVVYSSANFLFISSAIGQEYEFEQEPKKIALVIGNKGYKNLTELESSELDAKEITQRLRKIGFTVYDFYDVPTKSKFQNEILINFGKQISPGDFVVFYFSGHGFSHGPNNFLAPTDIPIPVPESKVSRLAISVDGIQGFMANHNPGLIMILLDACRSIIPLTNDKDPNIETKGHQPPDNHFKGINTFIVYSTKPGKTSEGFTIQGRMSVFTEALSGYITTPGKPFGDVLDDISSEVKASTNEEQEPGAYDWSDTNPYLNPTEDYLKDEREIWLSALKKKDRKLIQRFSYRYSISRYAAACRKWLDDDLNNYHTAQYTLASPVAIDDAWRPTNEDRVAVRRLTIPLAYARSVEENQQLKKAPDSAKGLIPSGTLAETQASLDFSLRSIDVHGVVVATQKLVGRETPNVSSPVVESIPSGTQLQINDVTIGTDKNFYVSATTFKDSSPFYIKVIPSLTLQPLELGQSIKEITANPRPNSLPELVNPALIEETIAELTTQGWKITWVSLSTAQTDDVNERDTRMMRLSNAEYILKRKGIDTRRITSVSSKEDFSGNGVRVRFFGIK